MYIICKYFHWRKYTVSLFLLYILRLQFWHSVNTTRVVEIDFIVALLHLQRNLTWYTAYLVFTVQMYFSYIVYTYSTTTEYGRMMAKSLILLQPKFISRSQML